MNQRNALKAAHRVVVKVGTSTLAYGPGRLNLQRMEKLIREIVDLVNQGREVVLVSSGAIAAGIGRLGIRKKPADIPTKQAVAAIGQGLLMHIYEKLFQEYGKTTAQILLTKENAVRHHQYLHSRQALLALLRLGAIPVVNENDAVAVDEIKIGDNDTLSAVVATLVDADALVILSDIEGLYSANPAEHAEARLLTEIPEITPEIEAIAGGAGSKLGTGGMSTKIEAAKIAMNAGVNMVIASGSREGVLHRVLAGEEVGTLFPARESHLRVRKSWLAFGRRLEGELVVDAGCEEAMRTKGSSLLAAGILSCEGEFAAGATVRVLTESGQEIARGTVNYSAESIRRLSGKNTRAFEGLLEDKASRRPDGGWPKEIIHRDNMVLMV